MTVPPKMRPGSSRTSAFDPTTWRLRYRGSASPVYLRNRTSIPWPGLTVIEGPEFYDDNGVVEVEWRVVYHWTGLNYREEIRFMLRGDEMTVYKTRGAPLGALFTVPLDFVRKMHEALGRLVSYADNRDKEMTS